MKNASPLFHYTDLMQYCDRRVKYVTMQCRRKCGYLKLLHLTLLATLLWQGIVSSPKSPYRLWSTPSFLFSGYRGPSPGLKRPGLDVNHSPLSRSEVKNEWSYASTSLYAFIVCTGPSVYVLEVKKPDVKESLLVNGYYWCLSYFTDTIISFNKSFVLRIWVS
jgi:hypothetical protein